jgi:uncharacterized protein YtpQ (UPF0354 family)
MNHKELKNRLEQSLTEHGWNLKWNSNTEQFEVTIESNQPPIEVSVPKLLQRINNEKIEVDKVVSEIVDQIQVMEQSISRRKTLDLRLHEQSIFPVMRSTSFPTETAQGKKLVYDEHTAESRIYYGIDLGKSYTLVDEALLVNMSQQELREKALFNVRRLTNEAKVDEVAGNAFYFISTTDGYGASRILNTALLHEYSQKTEGDFCLAIPHQDVLILADIRNSAGYDVLAQICFHFYAGGAMPITALPFDFKEGKLEPIFILAKRKPQEEKK